jgi:hypothetical protein
MLPQRFESTDVRRTEEETGRESRWHLERILRLEFGPAAVKSAASRSA